MSEKKIRNAAKAFAEYWEDKGYEKGESQPFWLSLLRDVYGIENPEQFITFEEQVHLDHTSFIDGHIPSTKVLIEQKGAGKALNKAIKQSDGSLLTPFEQAKRYITELPVSKHPRWVVTCNFNEFYVYDMERPGGDPEVIKLKDLPKEYYRLEFLVKQGDEHLKKEMEVSIAAGDIVGLLYTAFLKEYDDPENPESLKSLNKLCVRMVFCLYAEDAGIFGRHGMFHDYLEQFDAKHMRTALIDLFKVLDQKPEERDKYLAPDLKEFPYVNGGLFRDENIEIPYVTDEIRDLLLNKASADFDWSDISPTIFGAVFESTLNPETRRSGGMHYTSIENIHKVIDPLFLDDLKKEFENIASISVVTTRDRKLREFQDKLASLHFLDPACGSGNFLTESYLSLRRLENDVLRLLTGGQMVLDVGGLIKVSIGQFYGIEINDFAVTVAKTALWIAESQMMRETEEIVHVTLDFLPLKSYEKNIVEANALRIDWNEVIPNDKLDFIMGNPPFVGYSLQSAGQKKDIDDVLGNFGKNLDYVACWYKKAADYMKNTVIKTAFVSTNSISQGEQVSALWKPLTNEGVKINFAYKTFRWDSEASLKAHVHCVIIGFSYKNEREKYIFSNGKRQKTDKINAYLMSGPDIFIENRKKPICDVPEMRKGSSPTDGGYLIINSIDEKNSILDKESYLTPYIRKYVGSVEYINNKIRWCFWLKDVPPDILHKSSILKERLTYVKQFRNDSKKEATRKWSAYPALFIEERQPITDYLIIPRVSSQQRRYIPIGYVSKEIIVSDSAIYLPDASLYLFGILESNVHMAWMRTVCGRLKSDYRYSNTIVYNNFPWPTPTPEQKAKIEKTAQDILDARALYPDASLADLYDDLTMPVELRKAHQQNDLAVMEAYGFTKGTDAFRSEAACVAELMKLYQKKVMELEEK